MNFSFFTTTQFPTGKINFNSGFTKTFLKLYKKNISREYTIFAHGDSNGHRSAQHLDVMKIKARIRHNIDIKGNYIFKLILT